MPEDPEAQQEKEEEEEVEVPQMSVASCLVLLVIITVVRTRFCLGIDASNYIGPFFLHSLSRLPPNGWSIASMVSQRVAISANNGLD